MNKKIFYCSIFLLLPFLASANENTTIYQGQEVNADRVIVKFKDQYSFSNTILSKHHLKSADKIIQRTKIKALKNIYTVEVQNTSSLSETLASLKADNDVEYAEPDYLLHGDNTSNDTYFTNLWGMDNTGQSGGTVDADIDAPEAWDAITDCSSVVVGVIDSGIDYTHPDLATNVWQNPGEIASNGIDDDANGYIDDVYGWDFHNDDNDPMDDHSHGTHVAGTIGAIGNNSAGVAGVCWQVKLVALKFLDEHNSGWTSNAITAINYANTEGIAITNNSWGSGTYSTSLYNAIQAVQDEQIFVAAAGNDGTDNDALPHYPGAYNLSNIIAVTTTKHDDSQYYNYGATTVDLGAPGYSIYSTVPYSIYGYYYGYKSGTSMATPHVTGAAALLKAYKSVLTVSQIKDALVNTGDPLSSLSGKTVSGKRLNVYNALSSVNHQPAANIGGPYSGNEDTAINFDASLSTDADGDALTYSWDYGDSSSETTSIAAAIHIYNDPGTYTLSLIVNDGIINSEIATTTVTVNDINYAPVANIGGPYSGLADVEINFDASLSTDADGGSLNYSWDFGDGGSETVVNSATSHIYTKADTYTLSLIVSDGINNSTAVTATVAVLANDHGGVSEVITEENNQITVVYEDDTTKTFTAFTGSGAPIAALSSDNARIVAVNKTGKKIKILDALTGEVLTNKSVNKKKQTRVKLKVFDYNDDGNDEVIIASKEGLKLNTVAFSLKTDNHLHNKNKQTKDNISQKKIKIKTKKNKVYIKYQSTILAEYKITAKATLK